MSWLKKWKAISARIEGIEKAGNILSTTLVLSEPSPDPLGVGTNYILPELYKIQKELVEFTPDNISNKVSNAIKEFTSSEWLPQKTYSSLRGIVQSIASLLSFRAEFEYLIKDIEIEGYNRTERAFEHLKRTIIVNEKIREDWKESFNIGETNCEKLGAVHLLGHGIWVFKIHGEKGRTDLVYNEPLDQEEFLIRKTSSTLVLTEWKIATKINFRDKIEEAKTQIKDYKSGVLGDIELKQTRYIILVSEKQLNQIDDEIENEITYRHINIAVNPDTPSVNAKKQSKK